MENKEKIYSFLKANGFQLVTQQRPGILDIYIDTFDNGQIKILFSSDGLIETIRIKNKADIHQGYDIQIVKSYLFKEEQLDYSFSFAEQINYSMKHFVTIQNLFSDVEYVSTKQKLDKLLQKRSRQLLPNLFDENDN